MMAFWIKVDVAQTGKVVATTYDLNINGDPRNPLRSREGATVSQALRNMAAAMVYAKAEILAEKKCNITPNENG